MNTNDDTSNLTRVLYDALKDEDPRIAALFGHDTDILRPVLSAVLAEAAAQQWIQKQLDETGIRAMDFRNGIDMELEPARELLAHWVAAARTILGDAPNYTETKLSMDVKVAESPEMYTLVIQRHAPGALTPHEARQKAEARVAELEAQLAEAKSAMLREAADRFERECPDAGGPMDLCMCHAADPLREWADEREAAAEYARAITAPPSPETCAAIRERIEAGTAPRRRVRRPATEETAS